MFHITFFQPGQSECVGKNYESPTEAGAIVKWRREYPDAQFVYLFNKEINLFINR